MNDQLKQDLDLCLAVVAKDASETRRSLVKLAVAAARDHNHKLVKALEPYTMTGCAWADDTAAFNIHHEQAYRRASRDAWIAFARKMRED